MPSKIEELEIRAKVNPTPQNYFYLAEAYRDELNFENALEACNKGLEKQPDSVSGQVLLAEILFKIGRLDESTTILNNILRRAPETTRAYRILYEACIQKGDFQGARSALEKLFFFNPFDEEISEKLIEIKKIIEKKEVPKPFILPEEPSVERGEAEKKEEKPVFEKDGEELATRRISPEDFATMAREVKEREEEEAFVTPTMAEIYLKQGLLDKAIETYYRLYEMKKEEAFLKKAKGLEEMASKSSYYSAYSNLLEKFLERISQLKQGRS